MFRISTFVICLSLLADVLYAQNRNSTPEENTLLWEISGKGLVKPSYLFGTMHILCADDARLGDSLKYSIGESGEVFFELDMDNMAELLGMFRFIRMKDDRKLGDLLTPEEYQRVKQYFVQNPAILPLSMMERFKPYFISSMMMESRLPCEKKNGMEEVIMKEAKSRNKTISGLETVEFQASVFDSIPYEQQARDLVRSIDNAGRDDSTVIRMLELYRNQDMAGIEKLTREEEGGISGFLELFLYGRNAKWIPVMENAMKKGSVIFAVGAAHLPGEKGVIELLRKAGYRVRGMQNSRLMPGEMVKGIK